MLPIIIHTSSFYNFTTSIIREPIPFSSQRRLNDISSLIESFVLSDEIYYWNTGAFPFEWQNGYYTIPGNSPSVHPYDIFHGFDFIKEAPLNHMGNETKIIEMVKGEDQERVIKDVLGEEPNHPYTIWSTISLYVQAYNGSFGNCSVLEPQIIKDILPSLVKYNNSQHPVAKDPLIFDAYEKLKGVHAEKISGFIECGIMKVAIPPVTAILLSRLPDNCTDPSEVIRQLVELREELEPVRIKYRELEEIFYSEHASIKELNDVRSAMLADAVQLEKTFGIGFYENAAVRWFADNFSTLAHMLTTQGVSLEEIGGFLGENSDIITGRLSKKTPTKLYNLAMEAQQLKGISELANKKLGINI